MESKDSKLYMDEQHSQNTQTHDGVTLAVPPPQKKVGGYDMNAPLGKSLGTKKTGKEAAFDVTKAFTSPQNEAGFIVSDRRKTGPTLGQGLLSALQEWWAGTETPKVGELNTPPPVTSAPAPQPKKSFAPTHAELNAEVIAQAPKVPTPPKVAPVPRIAKIEIPKAVEKKEVPAEPVAPTTPTKEVDHVLLEKIRTFKKDIERVRHLSAPEQSAEKGPQETTPKKEEQKILPPKATRLGPLTVPDVRTATIAPLVTERTEVPEAPVTPPPPTVAPTPEPLNIQQVPTPTKRETVPEQKKTSWWKSAPKEAEEEPVKVVTEEEQPQPAPVPPPIKITPPPAPAPTPTPREEVIEAPVPEIREERPPYVPYREPVKHDELFPQKEELDDVLPTEDEIPAEKKLEFRSTIDMSALGERKHQEKEREEATQQTEGILSRLPFAPWVILPITVLLGAVLAIVASVYIHTQTTTEEPVTEVVAPSFFETESQDTIPLTDDSTAILVALRDRVETAKPGVTQFYPVVQDGAVERPATSNEFFSALDTQLSEQALRTLEDSFMIGSVTTTKNEPYLIVQSRDFDTFFTAFLAWEHFMRDDLAPLFGTVIPPEAPFTDMIVNNRSVRVLRDSSGETTLLLYSFVNKNTVVITKSEEALKIVLERF